MDFFEIVIKAVNSFGWVKGIFTIFFFSAHFWIYKLYIDRLKDRQEEIQRLAEDNHNYRDRLLYLLDQHFEYKKSEFIPENKNQLQNNTIQK